MSFHLSLLPFRLFSRFRDPLSSSHPSSASLPPRQNLSLAQPFHSHNIVNTRYIHYIQPTHLTDSSSDAHLTSSTSISPFFPFMGHHLYICLIHHTRHGASSHLFFDFLQRMERGCSSFHQLLFDILSFPSNRQYTYQHHRLIAIIHLLLGTHSRPFPFQSKGRTGVLRTVTDLPVIASLPLSLITCPLFHIASSLSALFQFKRTSSYFHSTIIPLFGRHFFSPLFHYLHIRALMPFHYSSTRAIWPFITPLSGHYCSPLLSIRALLLSITPLSGHYCSSLLPISGHYVLHCSSFIRALSVLHHSYPGTIALLLPFFWALFVLYYSIYPGIIT
jgi:hypothetical protein